MAVVKTPTEDEIKQAVDEGNAQLLATYAVALEYSRQQVSAGLPGLTEKYGNAKRDLDVCKASIKYFAETIKTLQSILKSLRP